MGALADILQKRGGYNERDALNAENGPRAQELAYEFGLAARPQSAQNVAQKTVDEILNSAVAKQIEEFKARAKEFDDKNPFAFDESLAKKSALEQFDPYYQKIRDDFLQGIEVQRRRGVEDQKTLLNDLNLDSDSYTGRAKQLLDRAINASQQGFADAGLFFSGNRYSDTGQLTNDTQQQLDQYGNKVTQQTRDINKTTGRTLEDLLRSGKQRTDQIQTQENYDVASEVERSRIAAQQKHELERQQYLGLPGFGGFGTLNIPSSIYGGG